ncbi:MAG TPA: hypothetical protein VGC53_16300 [Vicinamibacteria bacterium]
MKRLAAMLEEAGLEISERIPLSDLARERLGIEAAAVEVLYLNHPLLLLQCLFADGDPALLFPLVAIVRSGADSTEVCICAAWSESGRRMSELSEHLANQTKERLQLAAEDMTRLKPMGPAKGSGSQTKRGG